ncbi:MAG TPA: ATP-binding protein [Gemmatimonadaceae bacterium]|nr:ATP-binding protein [Gemmatimonadaceae bacterium]
MMQTQERAGGPGSRPMRFVRSLSLERQLPLLMSTVLAGILATSLLLTYETLRRTAEGAVRERLERAARQVASTVDVATRARGEVLRRMSRDLAVRRLVASANSATGPDSAAHATADTAARRALSGFLNASDSLLALEVWDADARRILLLGPDARGSAVGDSLLQALAQSSRATDSVRFSAMFGIGRGVYFWAMAPVVEGGKRIGTLVQQRRVSGPREMPRVFQELLGDEARLAMRNTGGNLWLTAPGDPIAPPIRYDTTDRGIVHERPEAGWMIAAEARVPGLPWSVTVESPLSSVRASARRTTSRLALISLLLMAAGALVSWLISRRITQPLVSLTSAAEALARGEHVGPIRVQGTDEIARLAASFNQMANQVTTRVLEAESSARALERANADLQHAMHEAHRARRDAERANRAKGDFLAVMSHELRTPLNAIAGYAQLLELGVHGPLSPSQQEAVSRITRSQSHLLRLINDVLNFSKIDAGQVRYEIIDVSIHDVILEIEPLIAPQMEAKGLEFEYGGCDGELAVRADREKLTQVLINLLSNAIKFTPSGGRVAIECTADGDQVHVRVVDTGIGIPDHQQGAIFDPFVQGERALHRPNEGVGLGLAISHDLAVGMGGQLSVESELGRGSAFTLTLERAVAALSRSGRAPYLSS